MAAPEFDDRIVGNDWFSRQYRGGVADEIRRRVAPQLKYEVVEGATQGPPPIESCVPRQVTPYPSAPPLKEELRKQPNALTRFGRHLKANKSLYIGGVTLAAVLGVGGVMGYAVRDVQGQDPTALTEANLTPKQEIAVNNLLSQPQLLKGFVCPSQLGAEGDYLSNIGLQQEANFYYTSAARERTEAAGIAELCLKATNVVNPSDSTTVSVDTDQGFVSVTRVMVLPDLTAAS